MNFVKQKDNKTSINLDKVCTLDKQNIENKFLIQFTLSDRLFAYWEFSTEKHRDEVYTELEELVEVTSLDN